MQRIVGKGLLAALFLLLCLAFPVRAQFHKPSQLTVRMGEELPEYLWQYAHRAIESTTGRDTVIRLADHRDKLIILDFWASWCGGCLYSLNKLDSLGINQSREDVLIIPVNYENRDRSMRVFSRFDWDYVSIVSDTLLNQVFPYQSLPHMVWIRDGRVWGFPKSQEVTAALIGKVAGGADPEVAMKFEDRVLDVDMPLFVEGNAPGQVVIDRQYLQIVRGNPFYRREVPVEIQKDSALVIYGNNLTIPDLMLYAFKDDLFVGYKGRFSQAVLIKGGMEDLVPVMRKLRYGFVTHTVDRSGSFAELKSGVSELLSKEFGATLCLGPIRTERFVVIRGLTSGEELMDRLSAKYKDGQSRVADGYTYYHAVGFGKVLEYTVNRFLREGGIPELSIRHVINETDVPDRFLVDMAFKEDGYESMSEFNKFLLDYGLELSVVEQAVNGLILNRTL